MDFEYLDKEEAQSPPCPRPGSAEPEGRASPLAVIGSPACTAGRVHRNMVKEE
ncbi:hypothetical protein [Leisingera sp. SS27]|uniref:hypothetical protein n=1 Tax=Leisingera sp. SS27 TaxID=2979462 RepID=UPI002330B05D|nr:hypothetical protein [Leisingera sp. SS27]